MKRSIRRWLGLAIVPAALALFGAVAPAQATTFECPGPGVSNPIPNTPFQGSIEVNQASGDCTIDYDVEATGTIDINVQNGVLNAKKITSTTSAILLTAERNNVTTLDLTAGTFLRVLSGLTNGATTGDIDIQGPLVINATEVQSGPPTTHGNVLLRAYGNVKTKDISTGGNKPGGGTKTGGVQIDAHLLSGQNVLFTIGADTANGVNGTISTETVTGGGTTGTGTILGGVRITNGVAGSTGGITLVKMNKIKVQASESRSGWIQLNARDGVLTLPANKLNADGMTKVENPGQPNEMTTHYMAGAIFLAAKTIETEDGTVISASQDPMASGSVHQVVIAAEEIKFKGADGLKIKADGNGVSQAPFLPATVYVLPKGGINPTSTGDQNNVTNLLWTLPFNGQFFQFPGKVFFNGDASAPLLISNDGNHTQTAMTGYPFDFKGGKVTITALGNLNHQIVMGYFGAYDGTKGLSFDNTGLVKIKASGKNNGDAGGRIQIQTDVISLKAIAVDPDPDMPPNDPRDILIKADGPSTGDGNGGEVIVIGTQVNLDPVSKARITADGAPNGTGNAIVNPLSSPGPHAVRLQVTGNSNLTFGAGAGRFKITATGGLTGGNAGSIKVSTAGSIHVRNTFSAIDASAVEDSANGGQIELLSPSVTFQEGNNNNPTQVALNAAGGANGDGGVISLSFAPNFDVNAVLDASPTEGTPAIVAAQAQLAPGKKGARVILNNVPCQEMQTTDSDGLWPRTYYNCVHPDGPESAEDKAPAQTITSKLSVTLRQTAGIKAINIYVFSDIDKHNQAFARSVSNVAAETWQARGNKGLIYESVFENIPGRALTLAEIQETAIHEAGHGFDHLFKQSNGSASQRYSTWIQSDLIDLDFLSNGSARPACTDVSGRAAPFKNMPQVCNGTTLRPEWFSNGVPMSNSTILENDAIAGAFFKAKLNDEQQTGFSEAYAQAFAYEAFAPLTTFNDLFRNPDQVFTNSYFPCIRTWAVSIKNNAVNPPANAVCGDQP
ncbi:MAG: hypothetical protein GC158_13700 [Cyanobacteria bacterium RI_101]|nr:hypothetical protein [Cyanobacteria bacterium RI_101]